MNSAPVLRTSLPLEVRSFLVEGEVVYNYAAVDKRILSGSSNQLWMVVTDRQIAFNAPTKSAGGGYSIEKGSIPIKNITGCSKTETSTSGSGCCGCSTRKVFHLRLMMAGSETVVALADPNEVDAVVSSVSSIIRRNQSS